jgi:hypothetical protein
MHAGLLQLLEWLACVYTQMLRRRFTMGIRKDKSTTYLAGLGYNVVRHPSAGFRPLTLLGRQNGAVNRLGPLNLLITNPPDTLPQVTADVLSADVNGQT